MKTKKLYIALMVLTALFLFTAQSVNALTEVPATVAYSALTADPSAVMFDTRSVDEYYGCEPPWNGTICPNPEAGNQGTANWATIDGIGLRLPFNVPLWIESGDSGELPENPAETTAIIEALLAAGQIDFDTPIYLICRSAWRSHYLGLWMENNTFFNALTGVTASFNNLYDIDSAGDPNAGTGGMLEWTAAGLPKWLNGGNAAMPPQIISKNPQDGGSSNSSATFEVTILEPTPGTNGAITSYATVTQTCVDVSGTPTCNYTDTVAGTVVNNYSISASLAGVCNDSFTWTSYATGTATNYSPNAWGSGADDTRTVTIAPVPSINKTNNGVNPVLVDISLDLAGCTGNANYSVCGTHASLGTYHYNYPSASWTPGCSTVSASALPLTPLTNYPVLNMTIPAGDLYFCFEVDVVGGGVYTDCAGN